MLYIEPELYNTLNFSSASLHEHKEVAQEISTLAKGGYELEPEDYLLIRDDEDEKITAKRLEKFVDKNYLGSALKLTRVKQSSGDLDIHTETLPGYERGSWDEFLNDANGTGDAFKEVILNLFEESLINKLSFVQVELKKLDIPSDINQAQLEEFLLAEQRLPYLVQIPLNNILSYVEDSSGIRWIKFKRIISRESPLGPTKFDLQFVLIDDENITTWTFYDVKVSDSGKPIQIFDPNLNNGKGGYKDFNKDKEFAYPECIEHSRGATPVVKLEIPDSLWMANQTYRAQKVINGLLTNLLHTAANAGFVQKWGRPYIGGSNKTNSSTGVSNAPIPEELQAELISELAKNMGDESLMFMDLFQFSELKGDSVTTQMAIIDDLKKYIFTSIAQNLATIEASTINAQSGTSKEIDLHLTNLALKNHGSEIISFARSVIKNVARAFGYKDLSLLNQIIVSGMNRFDIKPVDDALDTTERLLKLPKEALPSEILVEAIAQLAGALLENHSYRSKAGLRDIIATQVNKYLTNDPIPN